MKNLVLLFVVGIGVGAILAQKKTATKEVDPIDLVIEKSNQTMREASVVSKLVDEEVKSVIGEMRSTIVALEHQNEHLVEQVKVMESEIVAVKAVAPAQPFDVLAIGVPDTASRK